LAINILTSSSVASLAIETVIVAFLNPFLEPIEPFDLFSLGKNRFLIKLCPHLYLYKLMVSIQFMILL